MAGEYFKYLYAAVIVFNILCLVFKLRSRFILLVNAAFILAFVGGLTFTPDYAAYKEMYFDPSKQNRYEVGFAFVTWLCRSAGMSFNGFLVFETAVFGAMILWVFTRYSRNYALFFTCYDLYFLMIDAIQIRTFMATAVASIGFYYLLRRNNFMALVFVALSCTLHIETAFFLPLCFVNVRSRGAKKALYAIVAAIFLYAAVFLLSSSVADGVRGLGKKLLSFVGAGDKEEYFDRAVRYGWVFYVFVHIVTVCTTMYCRSEIKRTRLNPVRKKLLGMLDAVLAVQLYSVISFPLIMLNLNFNRLFRCLYVIDFAAWAVTLDYFRRSGRYYDCMFAVGLAMAAYKLPVIQGNAEAGKMLGSAWNAVAADTAAAKAV